MLVCEKFQNVYRLISSFLYKGLDKIVILVYNVTDTLLCTHICFKSCFHIMRIMWKTQADTRRAVSVHSTTTAEYPAGDEVPTDPGAAELFTRTLGPSAYRK